MRATILLAGFLLSLGCVPAKPRPLLTVGEYRMIVATMLAEARVFGEASPAPEPESDPAGAVEPAAAPTPLPSEIRPVTPDDPPGIPSPPEETEPPAPQEPEQPQAEEPPAEEEPAPRRPCDVQPPPARRFSFTYDGMRYSLDSVPEPGQTIETPRATFVIRDDPTHSTGRRVEVLCSRRQRPYEPGDEITTPRRAGYVNPKYGTYDYPFPDVWTHLRSHHGVDADHLSRREAERLHDSLH